MSFDAIIAWNPQDFPNTFHIYSVGELLAKFILVPQCKKYVEDFEKLLPLTSNILMRYTTSALMAYFVDNSARLSLVLCIKENVSSIITCTIEGLFIDVPFFRHQEVWVPRLETILHDHILKEITLAIIAQDYSVMEHRICSLRENCESLGIPSYSLPIIIKRMKNVVTDVVLNRRDIIEQPVHTRCILDEYFDHIAALALS